MSISRSPGGFVAHNEARQMRQEASSAINLIPKAASLAVKGIARALDKLDDLVGAKIEEIGKLTPEAAAAATRQPVVSLEDRFIPIISVEHLNTYK